jgi:hypothetical protein
MVFGLMYPVDSDERICQNYLSRREATGLEKGVEVLLGSRGDAQFSHDAKCTSFR